MRKLVPLTALAAALLDAPSTFAAGADTCAAPTVISALPYTDMGTTVGMTNDINAVPATCNGSYTQTSGPDVIYQVTLGPAPNSVTFTLDPTGAAWDPSIYVLTTCGNGTTCSAGRGDDNGGSDITEVVTLTNVPAGTYYFYVDSWFPTSDTRSRGTYTLSVTGNLGNFPAAPVASNGNLSTPEDMAGTVVLAATDANGDMLTYSVVNQPPVTEGSVTIAGNMATFTPAPNFNGSSSFTFKATDPGNLSSNNATISVTVAPVNDVPTAASQMQSTMEDMPIDVTLMGADVDVGDTLTYVLSMMPPANEGSVTLVGNVATFTPAPDFNGTTSFTFHVMDAATAMSDDATVTIDVSAVNDPPTATAQSATTMEDTPLMLTLTGTDPDAGDTIAFAIDSQPAMGEGSVMIMGNMAMFTPGPNFNGMTSFTFIATDAANAMSAPATVVIDVTAVNDAPTVDDNSASTLEDTPVDITLTGADVDMGDAITFEITQQPPAAEGSVTLNGAIATFTPGPEYSGQTAFNFRALDASMTASPDGKVNIMVGIVDDPPIFVDPTPMDMSTISVMAGQTINFSVIANDVDSTPTYDVMSSPAGASFDKTTGAFSWTTAGADVGTYAIKIQAMDATSTIVRDVTLEVTESMGSGGSGGSAGAGGGSSSSSSGNASGGMGGAGGAGETGGAAGAGGGTPGTDEGCGCTIVGAESNTTKTAYGLLFGLLALLGVRRRKN